MGVMKRNIPDEITAFKEKFFFGLTVRQLICGAGIMISAIPTGIFGSKVMPEDVVGYLIMFEVVPLAAVGWFSYNDMPVEQIFKKIFMFYFGTQKRKWKFHTDEDVIHEMIVQTELDELIRARKEELQKGREEERERKKQVKAEKKETHRSRKAVKRKMKTRS